MNFKIIEGAGKVREHKDQEYEIVVYTKGKGIYHAGEKEFEVSSGKITIMPPGVVHSMQECSGIERIAIRGEFNQIFNFSSAVLVSDNERNEGLLLAKMIYDNRYENPEYVSALVGAFAHFLLQSIRLDDDVGIAVKEIADKIATEFYDSNLNVSQLLNSSGYTEDYIRVHFKKITGRTPIEFLTKIRIGHACYLIDTYKNLLPLAEISEKCGYTDYVYFSRRFKQIMGVSPRTYMNEQ